MRNITLSLMLMIVVSSGFAQGLQRGGTPQTDLALPVNSAATPHPYRVIRDWSQLTIERRPWGGSNGVAIDRDGRTVWVTDRCTAAISPGCLGSSANPVHHFDETGREIKSFGAGMFVWPHGMFVPPHKTDSPEGAMGEGIAIDPRGNLYTAESILQGVSKYVRESAK